MELKRPLVVLAAVAALAGCGAATETGGNTDVDRGTTECGAAEAGASEQAVCDDTELDDEQQTDQEDDGTS
jgi:hypothetical protein